MDGKRKNMSLALISLVLISVGVLSAGCLDNEKEGDLVFTDPTGNVVKLDGNPERVVTLTPALTDILIELGSGDLIVGADSVSVSGNSGLSIEAVSTWEGLDSEKIVELAPDLVIMDKTLDITETIFNTLVDLGIQVYRIFPTDFNTVMETISDIGEILDLEDEAKTIVDDMASRQQAVVDTVSSVPEVDKPVVLYVTYYDGTSDPWVGTSSTFSGNLIETAGGKNAISDDSGVGIQVSVETIIDSNPDIIITSQSTDWPTPSRTTILGSEIWKDITAVKNDEIHDINGDLIDRTGPYLIDGLEAVNAVLYE